ncbi:hypothetical protein D3C85_1483480 [compost metagenome]
MVEQAGQRGQLAELIEHLVLVTALALCELQLLMVEHLALDHIALQCEQGVEGKGLAMGNGQETQQVLACRRVLEAVFQRSQHCLQVVMFCQAAVGRVENGLLAAGCRVQHKTAGEWQGIRVGHGQYEVLHRHRRMGRRA